MSTHTVDEKGILMACPACRTRNRLAWKRLAGTGRCGRCQGPLPGPSLPLQLASEAQFDAIIVQSALPVLVDFWAEWCGPCKMLAPELERLAGQAGNAFLVAKVDTEALPGLAARFAIRSIPSLVLFQKGRELARTAGLQPAQALRAFIGNALSG